MTMNEDHPIIASALADESYRVLSTSVDEASTLRIYDIELPERFRGIIPSVWTFVVWPHSARPLRQNDIDRNVKRAQQFISSRPRTDDSPPAVFLNASDTLRLRDQLPLDHPKIFFIEHSELIGQGRNADRRFAPFLMAVKGVLGRTDSALLLSPFIPGKPARNWRFRGRQRELVRLVSSPENFIVVGGRRMGKTSLLYEAEVKFRANGFQPFFVDLQTCDSEEDLTQKILAQLSLRDLLSLRRRHEIVRGKMLDSVLRRISGSGNVVLLLDELGNVLSRRAQDSWSILGALRQFAHSGKMRIIATSFQEFFLRQQDDYSGPWLNFASVMRLGPFEQSEARQFVMDPLSFWAEVHNASSLMELIEDAVGRHPLVLQHFCQVVFQRLIDANTDNPNLLDESRAAITTDLVRAFGEAVSELFYRIPSPLLKYLFLSFCLKARGGLRFHEMDDDWLERELLAIGLGSTTIVRRTLLEALEIRGLTQPRGGNHGLQAVVTPLVFQYLKKAERDLEQYRHKLMIEARQERAEWGLTDNH